MAWLILFVAGLFETAWAIGLKYTGGFSRYPLASAATAVAIVLSMLLLGYAMRSLPVGTAYAVWTGIGSVGAVILGIIIFGDSASLPRLVCVGMIVCGIIGLKVVTGGDA